jgi:hypothetical protein
LLGRAASFQFGAGFGPAFEEQLEPSEVGVQRGELLGGADRLGFGDRLGAHAADPLRLGRQRARGHTSHQEPSEVVEVPNSIPRVVRAEEGGLHLLHHAQGLVMEPLILQHGPETLEEEGGVSVESSGPGLPNAGSKLPGRLSVLAQIFGDHASLKARPKLTRLEVDLLVEGLSLVEQSKRRRVVALDEVGDVGRGPQAVGHQGREVGVSGHVGDGHPSGPSFRASILALIGSGQLHPGRDPQPRRGGVSGQQLL